LKVSATLILQKACDHFPTPEQLEFYKYDNPLEKKLCFDQVAKLPTPIANIIRELNTPVFLRFLEELTGINGLIPDPYYRGGGIHQIEKGGKLDIHIDFNKYTKLNLYRRVNVLLYLNKDWDESYAGQLEFWSGHKQNDKHVLEKCVSRILPIFNRLVVFSTSESSYHGHPEPLNCPDDRTRRSIATYYYTSTPATNETEDAHSTTFIKRPQDPTNPELEALRDKRSKGRIASNVSAEFTS